MPKRRQTAETINRIEAQQAEEARALAVIEAEALQEAEEIGKTWGLAPEEIEFVLRRKYVPLIVRAKMAARDIRKNGLSVVDAYGRARVSPSVVVEKDSIAGAMRILKALNIGLNPPPEPSFDDKKPWRNTR
jgi:hypothetical protein